jgi:hypothetical protein
LGPVLVDKVIKFYRADDPYGYQGIKVFSERCLVLDLFLTAVTTKGHGRTMIVEYPVGRQENVITAWEGAGTEGILVETLEDITHLFRLQCNAKTRN